MKRILIGGSPCTHWSIAQTNNRETEAEGTGWELFKNYLIAKEKFKPDFFLYENNKSAAQPIKNQISIELGVPLQYINSALVSAQNRQRFYAHNISDVPQPEDWGILLRDILESGVCWRDKSYTLDANYYKTGGKYDPTSQHSYSRHMAAEPVGITEDGKAYCLTSTYYKGPQIENTLERSQRSMVAEPVIYQVPHGFNNGGIKYDKAPTLTANGSYQHNNFVIQPGDKPVYEVKGGLITIKGKQYPIKLADGYYIIRKLTVTECSRLQTMPDDYCRVVSNTQAYKGLGNGWTAEIIIHILKHMSIPLDEEIQVLSMYDGIGTGRYCFDKLGYKNIKYVAYEIDKYAMQIAMSNYPDIIQCGDAFQLRNDDWCYPCTYKEGY